MIYGESKVYSSRLTLVNGIVGVAWSVEESNSGLEAAKKGCGYELSERNGRQRQWKGRMRNDIIAINNFRQFIIRLPSDAYGEEHFA